MIVPVGIAAILVPFSLIIGWNLLTVLLFWFMVIPALASYLPALVSKNKDHMAESLVGLMIFYGVMVFMIYEHYQTDYFIVMIISCFINMAVITLRALVNKESSREAGQS